MNKWGHVSWGNSGLQEIEYSMEENATTQVTQQQGSISLGLFGIFFPLLPHFNIYS